MEGSGRREDEGEERGGVGGKGLAGITGKEAERWGQPEGRTVAEVRPVTPDWSTTAGAGTNRFWKGLMMKRRRRRMQMQMPATNMRLIHDSCLFL